MASQATNDVSSRHVDSGPFADLETRSPVSVLVKAVGWRGACDARESHASAWLRSIIAHSADRLQSKASHEARGCNIHGNHPVSAADATAFVSASVLFHRRAGRR